MRKLICFFVGLAVLVIPQMVQADADIVVYLKEGNKVVPVKVTTYSDYGGGVVYVYRPSGASKTIPKSKICAIVNDGGGPYVHILNRCAFTPNQLAKIKKVQEIVRRRKEAISQDMEKERKARGKQIKAGSALGEAPKSDVTALPEDKRRMVFYDVVYYQDIGVGSRKAYEVVAVKYGLPLSTVNKIVIEGATKQWPMPPR